MIKAKILVVDDHRHVLTALELLLSREFAQVSCLQAPGQIPEAMRRDSFDAVLLDMNFTARKNTGHEGLFWLQELLKLDPELSVVMITAFGDIQLAVSALKKGAVDFVLKPWDNHKLLATMHSAIRLSQSRRQVSRLEREKRSLKSELDARHPRLIARSPAMKKVMGLVEKVALTDANILITGENGTGKEVLAREIHQRSARAEEMMVSVDLGAVPESLFESELFGHVKGAFTDAKTDRCGRMESAHQGTLFFDEIANLSLPLQAKLLTAIQNRSITRLGSPREIPLNIRLICASNMDLEAMVKEGSFRMDLLYRINTIQLELPPLRERGEDILLLANWFLHRFRKRYGKSGLFLSESAEQILLNWHWPGNVRELQHAMERAVILAEGPEIHDDSFQFRSASADSRASFDGSMVDVEERLIRYVIVKQRGNLSAVALHLGISRQTLYNKMKKYGI